MLASLARFAKQARRLPARFASPVAVHVVTAPATPTHTRLLRFALEQLDAGEETWVERLEHRALLLSGAANTADFPGSLLIASRRERRRDSALRMPERNSTRERRALPALLSLRSAMI